ncbi:MAG: glycoside hydrolase family 30 beta sandwich domain-containing protein [Planctomycetota bacterium]|jgi:O-glycosyl hydrolase
MNLRIRYIFVAAGAFILLANLASSTEMLPGWSEPDGVEKTVFELGKGKGQFKAWGKQTENRFFFNEFLPALFERTLVLKKISPGCKLEWIFTGDHGGFTVTIDQNSVDVLQRLYDSPAFSRIAETKTRHPEWQAPIERISYAGKLQAVTVTLDHNLGLTIALNGRTLLQKKFFLDLSRHQLKLTGTGQASCKMLRSAPEPALVRVNPGKQYQRIIGFGGITTPTAYAQLSKEGKRRWWQLLCEYNLLIQREYPNGFRLNESMDNWDRLEDATPHYYGDNFPNGEISDFEYIKKLRKLGGKVWFEFWALPPWAKGDAEKYAEAMVNYCKVSMEKAGMPPDIVGIQNEKRQSESMWYEMTLTLRKKLDEAGFGKVAIHMTDAGSLSGGIERIKTFRKNKKVWKAIDYSATHMYDYQKFFTDTDGFDKQLTKWKELTRDKPFLSTELCINATQYQWPTYRIALVMGELYHKNLVLTDASAICYCWTLLNVVQPSYGWTRTLFVPDRSHGFVPVASSHQLRVFGAFSRRIREGMVRVEAESSVQDLLVSAFIDTDSTATLIMLNRSTKPRMVRIAWPRGIFKEIERVDPYNQNNVKAIPAPLGNSSKEVLIEPGAIITLTSALLGWAPDEIIR